ncbi:MAG: KH domain-containing protein [Chloroflexi bacterium]|nr:KH domain-containing protein [Chloroflexota bacterium]
MKELVEYVATNIVDRPEAVRVVEVRERDRVVVRLVVDPADMGKVIGKEGRIAQALRTLLKVAAAQQGSQALLIIEPSES